MKGRQMTKRFSCGLLISSLTAPVLRAAEAGVEQIDSFGDVIQAGGIPMYVIIGFSVIGLFLVLFFLFTFRPGMLFPRLFLEEAGEVAERGDLEALRLVCQAHSTPAAKVMLAAVEQMAVSERVDYLAVRDAIDDEGSRQAGILWQRLQYLMDIAIIAPMVGLLGTVLGMLESFANMQTELGAVRPASLSAGVAKALITTAGGLIVGITAMVLYALLRGRLSQLIGKMEELCALLLRRFVGNYKPVKR